MPNDAPLSAESPARRPIVRERSYPLVALLQLATVWGAMFACVDGEKLLQGFSGDAWQWIHPGVALAVFVGIAAMVGAALGLTQVRMWRGALVGGTVGAVSGVAIFAVYAAPAGYERAASAAGVLLLTTIVFRYRVD